MSADSIREKVAKLIEKRGLTFSQVSTLIGRPRYFLFFYIRKKSPKVLPESERHKIAELLGIDEQELTDLPLHRIETMTDDEIREHIDEIIKQKGFSYNKLSILIGKQQSYMFQFIKRKTPKRLDEVTRRQLAEILDVDEQELTDLPLHRIETTKAINQALHNYPEVVKVEMLDVTACCGNGVDNVTEKMIGEWVMPLQEFRQITFAEPNNVKMLKVIGDSMMPTLKAGDWVLVDISQQNPDTDGMYLLSMVSGLVVKRLQLGISDFTIISDNPKYKPITASAGEVKVIGRVIYTLNAERVG